MKCPQCQTENPPDSKFCKECATPLPQKNEDPFSVTHTMKPAAVLSTGSLFTERFRIIEELGAGGMGKVYRVRDEKLNEEVVLKLIRPDIASDPKIIARFRNELKTARKIGHPNVARTYDLNESGGMHYITMDYVRGENLKRLIRKVGRMSPAQAIAIARQICAGLSEAHKLGVIHRDLKPQNIMVDENGRAMIVDFGIARSLHSESLTDTGVMIGTPEYMAPEQAEGDKPGPHTDIYALGVILYEMLTGEPPFSGHTPVAIAMQHKTQSPPDPAEKNPDIPESLSLLILQLLEKDPSDRPLSASDVYKKLNKIENSLSTPSPIPEKMSYGKKAGAKSSWIKYGAAASIIFILVIFAYLLFKPAPAPSSPSPETASTGWDNSIAVLPFRDLSPDKNQEHISFGMTEALSDRLSRIEQLKVSSPTSVMRYRDTQKDVKTIGVELGVANLVEGSIQVAEGYIRIRGQLTDAATGFTLWAESYEGEMKNIFTLQDEVSQSIAQALELELSLEAMGKTGPQHPENLVAYEAYVRGMNHFASRYMFSGNPSDFQASAEMIEKAIEIDPEYAEAYAGLAWIYTMNFAGLSNPYDKQKADYYAEEAYKLNPESGLANSLYGTSFYLSGQYDEAYQLLKKSLALNPNQAESQFLCAVFLRQLGLAEPAFNHFQKALELNPFFILATGASGICKAMLGEPDNAVHYFDLEKENNPKLPVLGSMMQYLLGLGREEKAAEYIQYIEKTYPDHRDLPHSRALMLAAQGKKKEALEISRGTYIFALLQLETETLASIEQSIRQSDKAFNYLILKLPVFDFLREKPRFERIVAQQKAAYQERLHKYGDL